MVLTPDEESVMRRRADDLVPRITASPALAGNLQQVLVDLIELRLQGKQAHWNMVGHGCRNLHRHLDEIIKAAEQAADKIAERMRALGTAPDGSSDKISATTTLPAFPDGEQGAATVAGLFDARLRAAAATLRQVRDEVDAEDPPSADLLHAIIDGLERSAWLMRAEIYRV